MTDNPLLNPFNLRHQATPFNTIKVEHYMPAIKQGLIEARKNVAAIKNNADQPTFENTVLALETCSETLDRATTIYFGLRHAHGDEKLQMLAGEMMPLLSEFSSDISLDNDLFQKIKQVYEADQSHLSTEEREILSRSWKSFVRNGALLTPADQAKLRQIDQELAALGPKFSDNVLKATNAFQLLIEDKEELTGLSESNLNAAAAAAKAKNHPSGWLFTLQAPSYMAIMEEADNRTLREKVWRALITRTVEGEYDNRTNVADIARLRQERSQLLGFESFAHFQLEERMAKTPATVNDFLQDLLTTSKKVAVKELSELKDFARTALGIDDFQRWDQAWVAKKYKEKLFAFDEDEVKPFFKLENVVNGVFEHARRLYGLSFSLCADLPTYQQDVEVWEVSDEKNGSFMGLLYMDYFPRETKAGGAWCGRFRGQKKNQRPHVNVACNFSSATDDAPSLLTLNEVTTLFHEFGHALHSLLSNCEHESVSCTSVLRDFVELPSQIMENWVLEREALNLFATHYQTGEPISDSMVSKIKKNAQYLEGLTCLRQVSFGLLDMAWHMGDYCGQDVLAFENKALAPTNVFPDYPGTSISTSFSHIFGGGYAAGYYGYKWAEVLDADAFELFKQEGLFNSEVADKFRTYILAAGGSEHPMELYKKFRGRAPDPQAFYKRSGFI